MGSDELSPREQARAACPPGRPAALFTLDEIRARRRNSLELDRLCTGVAYCTTCRVDEGQPHEAWCQTHDGRYVQPHDGYRPSQLPHNGDYGVSDQGEATDE